MEPIRRAQVYYMHKALCYITDILKSTTLFLINVDDDTAGATGTAVRIVCLLQKKTSSSAIAEDR